MFSSRNLALGLAGLASSVLGAVLDVQVGPGGQLVYDPPYVSGVVGDVVRFHFNPKNHTVTQGSFDPPCVRYPGGFASGFIPVAAGTDPLPTFDVEITDPSVPLWVYCGQVNHCGSGMVFAINPPTDVYNPQSFEAYRMLAIERNGTATATTAASTPVASETASVPATPVPTTGVVHPVRVGPDGTLTYAEESITAAVGDVVTFTFLSKNHTVTQSSFDSPCTGLSGGFRSGFRPVPAGTTEFPTFSITVNDTRPIWGYCGQTGHCAAGMVFAINAPTSGDRTFQAFKALARSQTSPSGTSGGAPAGASGTAAGSGALGLGAPSFVVMALSAVGAFAALL